MSKGLEIVIGALYTIFALIGIPTIVCYIIVLIANRIQNKKLYAILVIITCIFWISLALVPLCVILYYDH